MDVTTQPLLLRLTVLIVPQVANSFKVLQVEHIVDSVALAAISEILDKACLHCKMSVQIPPINDFEPSGEGFGLQQVSVLRHDQLDRIVRDHVLTEAHGSNPGKFGPKFDRRYTVIANGILQ